MKKGGDDDDDDNDDDDDEAEFDTLKTSNQMFNQYALNGYANVYIDDEDFKTVRLIKPFTEVNENLEFSFSSKIAEIYAPDKFKRYKERDNELEVINYKRNIDKYPTLNYNEVINEKLDLSFIKDRIVLIGYLRPKVGVTSTEDIFYTPMNKNFAGKTAPDMYGLVIHSNVVSMILEEDYIYRTSDALAFILMIVIVYMNMILFNYWRRSEELLKWYQPYTIILILSELIGFTLLMIYLMHWFKIELRFAASFFAIMVTVLSFVMFTDSLKPIIMGFIKRYQFNKLRKEGKEQQSNEATEEVFNIDIEEVVLKTNEINNTIEETKKESNEDFNDENNSLKEEEDAK